MACIEEERKKAFVVFASTYKSAVKYLTLEQLGELFIKLGKYSFEGEIVSSDNPLIDTLLNDAMPNMDGAERRHLEAIENGKKGKEHGYKGGRPRKGETREEYDARRLERYNQLKGVSENPQKPLDIDIDIDTNTDRDIDKKKEIDIDRYKNTDVKKDKDKNNKINVNKNTNSLVNSNSVSTNQVSFSKSQNPVLDNTKKDEEPSQEKAQYHVSSLSYPGCHRLCPGSHQPYPHRH